ncbi:isochorismate synthase [Rubrobacter indicoceani]|uniref:isochorismate synthase n=1 Tax=Rubrobacter indicoceani TaxID=2051957 RepID=UPI000E5BC8B5|nr:isochorismate synthase [Rubrobacter indicoceani]
MIKPEDTPAVRLSGKVEEALLGWNSGASSAGAREIVRVSVATGDASPLGWLAAQARPGLLRAYWSGRDDARSEGREAAMVGVADSVARVEDVLLTESRAFRARYYGGFRFDPGSERGREWAAFGEGGLFLPRFEFVRDDSGATLSCNLVLPDDAGKIREIVEQAEALAEAFGAEKEPQRSPRLTRRLDTPEYETWRGNVERVTAEFRQKPGKVVFARRADLTFEAELDPLSIFKRLKARTPGCFHFYFEPARGSSEAGAAFIGATPERLYGRDGRAVRSEAVAGTRPRGTSGDDDAGLRKELLGSEKDRAEQRYVRDSVEEDLRGLCAALTVEEGVSEMKLASRRHLVSRFRGTLGETVTDAEILDVLHPTPAVGGYPKPEAMEEIRASENFDRGLYAGPVGWVSGEGAEFAVGIRSGLVCGKTLSLFSGAGIVAGSTPAGEWAEIEQKISDFVDILSSAEDPEGPVPGETVLERAG